MKMNKTILKGIGVAVIALGCYANVDAAEQYTVNSSEDYVDVIDLAAQYANFATSGEFCDTDSCTAHGQDAVSTWVSDNFFEAQITEDWDVSKDSGGLTDDRFKFVPRWLLGAGPVTHPNNTYQSDTLSQKIFGVGVGLPDAWLSELREPAGINDCGSSEDPMTTPGRSGIGTLDYASGGTIDEDNCSLFYSGSGTALDPYTGINTTRDEWVDQIVIGYIKTGDNFAQNFRSQLTFGSTMDYATGDVTREDNCVFDASQCEVFIDQRLEQGDTDMENVSLNAQTDGAGTLNPTQVSGSDRIVTALQTNAGIKSGINTSHSPHMGTFIECGDGTLSSEGCLEKWAENVEQNVAGYFYSCINCNLDGGEHEYSAPEKAAFQAWLVDQPEITSIIHAGVATETSRLN